MMAGQEDGRILNRIMAGQEDGRILDRLMAGREDGRILVWRTAEYGQEENRNFNRRRNNKLH
jgi:hypothetical protein